MSAATAVTAVSQTYDYEVEFKGSGKDLPLATAATVAVTSSSSGDLDASLLQYEREQRAKRYEALHRMPRASFMQIMVSPHAHSVVVQAYQPLYGDKAKYGQYLRNVCHDVGILEPLMQKAGTPIALLPSL